MAIGPSDEEISFIGTRAVAIKQPGATKIEAQAYRKNLRPDISSSTA